jgi:hypothetical protein
MTYTYKEIRCTMSSEVFLLHAGLSEIRMAPPRHIPALCTDTTAYPLSYIGSI